MGSHKKQAQLQCALVHVSRGTGGKGGWFAGVLVAKGVFPDCVPGPQQTWGQPGAVCDWCTHLSLLLENVQTWHLLYAQLVKYLSAFSYM